MKNQITKYLKQLMEVIGFLLAIIGFLFNDYEQFKKSTMIQYITEHWNWWVIAFLFAIFIKLFRLTIREDIKSIHSDMIKLTLDLQKVYLPSLAMNNIFIREVLLPTIPEKDLYDLLEYNVFENKKFNISDLETFGIEQKYIDKLRKKYHEIESKKNSIKKAVK